MTITETRIIDQLSRIADVHDVYFHRGTLFIVNESDVNRVEDFLFESGYDVLIRLCQEEPAF